MSLPYAGKDIKIAWSLEKTGYLDSVRIYGRENKKTKQY